MVSPSIIRRLFCDRPIDPLQYFSSADDPTVSFPHAVATSTSRHSTHRAIVFCPKSELQ
ncbi:MAG: hypothetical protein IT448_01450 [Phycisphaerales bacterium]|nr:hypothetical protein [Phycisphaerales bacterium]